MNRWWILSTVLAVLAWLVITDRQDMSSNSVSAPVERDSKARNLPTMRSSTPTPAKSMVAAIHSLKSRHDLLGPENASYGHPQLFTARSWIEPVVPSLANKDPVVEQVPDFPYTVVGRKKVGDSIEVFLTREEENFVVREGQILESDYTVTHIGATSMTVVYTRLNHAHEIQLGDME